MTPFFGTHVGCDRNHSRTRRTVPITPASRCLLIARESRGAVQNRRLIAGVCLALATTMVVVALFVLLASDSGGTLSARDAVPDNAGQSGTSTGVTTVTAPRDGTVSGPGDEEATGQPTTGVGFAASSYLEIVGLKAPETYEAKVTVIEWEDRAAGVLEVRVNEATLLGPLDALTGEELSEPYVGAQDRSDQIEGVSLLVSATGAAAGAIPSQGECLVHLVMVPSGEGAVFWIDKVVE
jgi:hypothetical protein